MFYVIVSAAFILGFLLGMITLSKIARKHVGKMRLCSGCECYKDYLVKELKETEA